MCGIYKIENKINGKIYIGQSIHIEVRFEQHKREMNYKNKCNKPLYLAFKKYGLENFDFSIVEECLPAQLNERETYWINYYNSQQDGYNLTEGGEAKFFSHEQIYKAWDEGLSNKEIAEKLGIGTSTVYYALINYQNYTKTESKRRGGKLALQTATHGKKLNTIYQYDLEGNFLREWESCKEAARINNWSNGGTLIGKVLNGHRKSAYGYRWSREKIDKLI